MYEITLYAGIAALFLITFSFLSGMRIIKLPAKLRLHKKAGVAAFFLVLFHGLTMLYFYYFS